MLIEIVIYLFAFIALGTTVYGGYKDFKIMMIPNQVSIIVIMTFVAGIVLQYLANYMLGLEKPVYVFQDPVSHLIAAAVTLVVTFGMFSMKMIGGGDSKLATALALWIGLQGLPGFLIVMAFVGGVIGVLSIVFKRTKPFKNPNFSKWISKTQAGESVVPYGIALASAAIFSFYHAGFLFLGS